MPGVVFRITVKAVVLTALVGAAMGLAGCGPQPCPAAIAQFADAPVKNISAANAERAVFCLTNAYRAANGRAALTSSTLLSNTAKAHAQDAVTRKWWLDNVNPHVNPDGKSEADRIRAAGYCLTGNWRVAENVYWGWGVPLQTPRRAVDRWISSPPHQATILDPLLRELGVGVVRGAPRPGTFPDAAVFVQNFGACT